MRRSSDDLTAEDLKRFRSGILAKGSSTRASEQLEKVKCAGTELCKHQETTERPCALDAEVGAPLNWHRRHNVDSRPSL